METLGEFLAQFDGMDRSLPVVFRCSIESDLALDVSMEADCEVTLIKGDFVYDNTEDKDDDEDEQFEGLDENGDETEGNRIVEGPVVFINVTGQCTNSQ